MEDRLGEMRKGRRERIEKGSHCFFKSSGYDKLEHKHKNLVFFKLIECIIKKKICHGVKQYPKICAIEGRAPTLLYISSYASNMYISTSKG